MKRTLALIGLILVGGLLLLDPDGGVVAVAVDPATPSAQASTLPTTTGEPPEPTTTRDGSSSSSSSSSTTTTTTTTGAEVTVVGESVSTRYGPFQVEIVVESGLLVDVVTVEAPSDRHSERINDYAIPLYEESAISSQSADIDAISGATITWQAWTASLESAMAEAGL